MSLATAVVLLAVLAHALHVTVRESQLAAAQVAHSHEVLDAANELGFSAVLLDSSQRGLLVTQSGLFRQARDNAVDALRRGARELGRLTADNPQQQERVRDLLVQIDERARLAEANEQAAATGMASLRTVVESPVAKLAASALQSTLELVKAHERELLGSRQQRLDQQQQRTLWIVAATIVGSALLLILAGWGYRRQALAHGRAESRFRDLVHALPVSLWQVRAGPDKRLQFEFVSDNAGSLRQVDVQDPRSGFRTIVEEDRPRVQAAVQRSIDELVPYDVEYRVPVEGGVRWIRSSAHVRRAAGGSVLLSGYWADVTGEHELLDALKAARDEATLATHAKSAFLAAMSHEIRTPMNGVLGLLELLGLSRLDAEQKATLSVVRSSSQALLRIVDDILDFSKMEADRLTLYPAPASLRQLADATCQVYASHASGKGLLLHCEVDAGIARTHVFDRQRVGQILNNLVSNALKFTDRGTVSVRVLLRGVERDVQGLAIVVEDTGIGVPAEDVARLFQPFVQSGHDTASRFGGTGLGLVISRRLAELMGGTLTMDSVQGRGTRMTLEVAFPVSDVAETAHDLELAAQKDLERAVLAHRDAPGVAQAQAEGTLVLVVDDHPTNRMVLKRQLQSLGYAAETVADGVQGFDAWKTGGYALVVADVNMPEMNGYELVRAIRAHEARHGLARTPVFACTANAMPSEASVCAEAGMDEYLIKPIGLGALSRHLTHWLPLPTLPAAREPLRAGVDPRTLHAISGGDAAVESELLDDYRRTHESDAVDLRAAVGAGDCRRALQVAHRIRGACMALGSLPLAEATAELEDILQEGALHQVPAALAAFDAELARLFAALDGQRRTTVT